MQKQNQNWMPLQSNPEVMNEEAQRFGINLEKCHFVEILSIEQWALQMITQPVLGVVFLYQQTPVQIQFQKKQSESIQQYKSNDLLFYMKQYAHNACGTIAIFHTVLNAIQQNKQFVKEGSIFEQFYKACENKSADQRGKQFLNSMNIKNQHMISAKEGQSCQKQSVDSHFISFVCKNQELIQLDGCKKGPVFHGKCDSSIFLNKCLQVIKQFMARDPDNLNFSIIAFTKVL